MSRARAMFLLVAFGAALGVTGCTLRLPSLQFGYGELREEVLRESPRFFEWNKILLIDIDGFIGAEGSLFVPRGITAADIKEKLMMAAKDRAVRGILLRIDSPGGEVTSCDIIYQELRAFAEQQHKPIVAYTMTMATSGGYYLAIAADRIVANPTTVTGNVGVVMQFVNIEKLCSLIGVQTVAVKSGERKDMGSPLRPMQPEEQAMFQAINQVMFDHFLALVRARRKLSDESARVVADGRILSAPEAKQLGLIDRIGGFDDALDEVKRLARIGEADVVAYTAFPHYNHNVYARFAAEPQRAGALDQALRMLVTGGAPRFLYLWTGGSASR